MTKTEKLRILTAQLNYMKKKYPDRTDQEHGWFNYITRTDTNANGLTWLVENFLNWSGHFAKRVSVQGQARPRKIIDGITGQQIESRTNGVVYTKSSTIRGAADIDSKIKVWIGGRYIPLSVEWEVKIGKDRQSVHQKLYQAAIARAEGYYFIIKSLGDFFHYYDVLLAEFPEPSEQV